MKIEGYEEISEEEYKKIPSEGLSHFWDCDKQKFNYFKKAQKFPICFKDDSYRIEVFEDHIKIIDLDDPPDYWFRYNMSFPLLVKAVEKAKEVMKKNG